MKRKTALWRYMTILLTAVMTAAALLPAAVHAEETDDTIPDNGIPVIYINIDETRGTIADMYASKNHSVYCYGTMNIDVPEGFHYSDFPDLACESFTDLGMSIRGRGNSTWQTDNPKKPFKLKLDKKEDLFGLGKNKHWVLVANAFDSSLMKDRITAWLGDRIGFEFTPRGVPVDVVLHGEEFGTEYLGSYYLSENVRVDTNRLEIDELTEEDTEEPAITGGYLLQDALQVRTGSPDRFYTSRGVDWATHTPSFDTEDDEEEHGPLGEGSEEPEDNFVRPELADAYDNPVQQKYIQNHMQIVEDALYSEGTGYRDYMDIESAAKYWLINELSKNADGYGTGSTYIYKKRDADGIIGKMYWGPLWDFDFGWDSRFITHGFTVGHEWVKPLFCDREPDGFLEELKKQWTVLKVAALELIKDGGVMDQYCAETLASANCDYEHFHPGETFDYPAAVEHLKDWIRERVTWMDENFGMVDSLVHTVRFMADSELYALDFKAPDEKITGKESHPDKEGYVFTGWADEDGNIIETETAVERDMILTAQYISEDEATYAEDIAFRKNNDVMRYSVHVSRYAIDYKVIPEDATYKEVEWSSSDEDFAAVDENGIVSFSGCGTVTLTAKLKNGVTREFTLTILEEDPAVPESVYPLEETVYMKAGEQTPVTVDTVPSPAKINRYAYVSDNEDVVTVDEYGILTAAGPGETTVRVQTETDGSNWGDIYSFEAVITVIVSEDSEPDPAPDPAPAEIVYTVVSGGSGSWKKGSTEGFTVTVKRSEDDDTCITHFRDVKIDGRALVRNSDYTAVKGSTIVMVKASVLEKLADGTHTVTVEFDDGSAETVLKILSSGKSPDTGDPGNDKWVVLLAATAGLSALLLVVLKMYGGRKE